MVKYKILYSKLALKDAKKLSNANLDIKAKELIEIIRNEPFQNPPPYEKLVGNLTGSFSRRINIKHRIVVTVHLPLIKLAINHILQENKPHEI